MSETIIAKVTKFVEKHMLQFDASHNFAHVMRVHDMAVEITEQGQYPEADVNIIKIAALMHDVNDHKYMPADADPRMIYNLMIEFGATEKMAQQVDIIVNHVSYSYEIANCDTTAYKQIIQMPELRIVQDADRLDALGKDGVDRCIIYNKSKGRDMLDVIEHFHDKLYKLSVMMKTQYGTIKAIEKTVYIEKFEKQYLADL